MLETGIRDEFVVRDISYFEQMLDCIGPDNIRLYLAYYEGKLIAGTIAVVYGNKCWYLYGASSNEHRNLMPNYLLQWEMINGPLKAVVIFMILEGYQEILMKIILCMVFTLKKGFGGKFTEFIGELDYVFNPFTYLW